MKARVVAIMIMIWGALLILIPWTIFPVCGIGPNAAGTMASIGYHGCQGTLRAETALGLIALGLAAVPLLWPQRRPLLIASLGGLLIALLAILFPTVITGMCRVPTMPCRMGTLPALIIVSVLLGLCSAAGLALSRKLP